MYYRAKANICSEQTFDRDMKANKRSSQFQCLVKQLTLILIYRAHCQISWKLHLMNKLEQGGRANKLEHVTRTYVRPLSCNLKFKNFPKFVEKHHIKIHL